MTLQFFTGTAKKRRTEMTVCPIAIAVGCKKCLLFDICFVKTVIGDYKEEKDKKDQDGKKAEVIGKQPK